MLIILDCKLPFSKLLLMYLRYPGQINSPHKDKQFISSPFFIAGDLLWDYLSELRSSHNAFNIKKFFMRIHNME